MAEHRHLSPDPLVGITVIGLIGLACGLLGSVPQPGPGGSAGQQHATPASTCAYILYEDDQCIGTVFPAKASTLSDILAHKRPTWPVPLVESAKEIPCETCLRLRTRTGAVLYEPMKGAQILAMGHQIELNRAQTPDLVAIPGIGPTLAERLITYRNSVGGFSRIEDLAGVRGLGTKKLAAIRPFVKVTSFSRRRVAGRPSLVGSP